MCRDGRGTGGEGHGSVTVWMQPLSFALIEW